MTASNRQTFDTVCRPLVSDDVTALGTAGQIALGLTGLDVAADVRDLTYDLANWQWSGDHIVQTALDAIGFIPGIGILKNVDEVATLLKAAGKNSDEIAAVLKVIKNGGDNAGDLLKSLFKGGGEAAVAGSVADSGDEALGGLKAVGNSGQAAGQLAEGFAKNADEASEAIGDTGKTAASATEGLTEGAGKSSSLVEEAGNVDVSTSAHQAVFYSGEGNRAQAEAFAQLNGKTTLEMTPGGKYFESLKLFDPGSPVTEDQALEIWKILSERYAKSASGNVYGFVKGSRPGSIFNTVEYQALQKNPYITNIYTELFK